MTLDRFVHPTLLVHGVNNDFDENKVQTYFEGFGPVHHIKSYFNEGFAFVRMIHRKDAHRALENYRHHKTACPFLRASWARHGNSLRSLKHHH